MGERPEKRKQGPQGGGAVKKSKGGSFGRWKTPKQNANEAARVEMGTSLAIGDEGIWVTFARGMKTKAVREFLTLCEEFGESLYGIKPPSKDSGAPKDDEDNESLDIDASIQKELDAMKSTKSKPTSRNAFTIVNTGIECVFFTKTTKPVVPTELVTKICEDALACGDVMKRRTKYINRLTPVSGMEKATENGLIRVARAVMAPYFDLVDEEVPTEVEENSTAAEGTNPPEYQAEEKEKEADKPGFTYAIRHSVRSHAQMKSDTIVKKVASLVRAEKHKVDLGKPDKVVLVEVFQMFCGLSVVNGGEWERMRKYNVNELYRLASEMNDKEDGGDQGVEGEGEAKDKDEDEKVGDGQKGIDMKRR